MVARRCAPYSVLEKRPDRAGEERYRGEGNAMGKFTKRAVLVGAALALTVGGGAACLATAGADSADRPKEATGAEYIRVSEWARAYPTQYDSFAQYQVRENVKHGHYGIGMRLLAPVDRQAYEAVPVSTNFNQDENGLYKISGFHYDQASEQWVIDDDELGVDVVDTRIRKSCFSCKSSYTNVLFEEEGTAFIGAELDEEFVDAMSGQVWDCGLCHTDIENPSEYDVNNIMYSLQLGDDFDVIAKGERVCAPCHASSLGGFNVKGITAEEIQALDPFGYGLELEGLMQRALDNGSVKEDEATGMHIQNYAGHYDVEVFQGSVHQSLGMGCVDCHMATVTDPETGETYTNHNASGSPLDSPDTVAYCLTCHGEQGIESAEAMVAMVRDLQAENEAEQAVVRANLEKLYAGIADAVASGSVDEEALDQARSDYETAFAYVTWCDGKSNASGATQVHDGGKVAHDPEEIMTRVARAKALSEEGLELLGL